MSNSRNSKDSPNVEPQSLRPVGHDVSTSYTGNQEDRHQVGEPSNRDALRREVTTEPEKLSPESVYVHQTHGKGAPIPWHLGPKDRPVLDEGLETSISSIQAERWNRLTPYGNRRSLENVATLEESPSASSHLSNRLYKDSRWQSQGLTNPIWPSAGGPEYEQDSFEEKDPQIATGYSTSPDGKRPNNPVNPFGESTLTNPLFPRLEPTRSPLVTPAHSNPGASNPTNTVIQKKTVSRKGKEGEKEITGNRAEGLQPYRLTYISDVESSGEERKGKTERVASLSENDWNRATNDYQGYVSSNEGALSDGDQYRVTVRKAKLKRKVARKDRPSSSSSERLSDEGAVGGVAVRDHSVERDLSVEGDLSEDSDQSDTERGQNQNEN